MSDVTYVVNRGSVKVGDTVYRPGDVVPGAADFPRLDAYIRTGRLRQAEHGSAMETAESRRDAREEAKARAREKAMEARRKARAKAAEAES